MKGIRLYPKYHDYEVIDPALIELVKQARDLDLPVAFSLRMVDSRQRSWMDISSEWELRDVMPIIREVPDAKYLILNLANSLRLDNEDTELLKNANVLFDTSGREISHMHESMLKFGKGKFAYGSHAPLLDNISGLIRIESLTDTEADEETKELLRSGNAMKFLKI